MAFRLLRSFVLPAQRVASSTSFAPSRSFFWKKSAAEEKLDSLPDDVPPPADIVPFPTYVDEYGFRWSDTRPQFLRDLESKLVEDENGELVGEVEGVQVVVPIADDTLEWILSTPVDTHLFEEQPIIKLLPSESEELRK